MAAREVDRQRPTTTIDNRGGPALLCTDGNDPATAIKGLGYSRDVEKVDTATPFCTIQSAFAAKNPKNDDNSPYNPIDEEEPPSSWACSICTFKHLDASQQLYLACELCGSPRSTTTETDSSKVKSQQPSSDPTINSLKTPPPSSRKRSNSVPSSNSDSHFDKTASSSSSAWGSLRPPSAKDICPRKRQKAFDAPPPLLDYLIVLDFEWTADDKQRMRPVAEITQFPSVAMKLVEKRTRTKGTMAALEQALSPKEEEKSHPCGCDIPTLPMDLTASACDWAKLRQDAVAVSAFDTFVRPTFNPRLTDFSIQLTAITQAQVDAAPTIDMALKKYMEWLASLDLVDAENGTRKGNWCFATWGDGDIMSTLRLELQAKSVDLPSCFDRWINLKCDSMFKKHYGREPRGGLRTCVESVGAEWEGRAHNGLVDSINTAKIVRHMVQTGFRFTRATRGIGKGGVPFGQKKK